jgi:thiol-disulfide isomerase/thioredoxin
MKSVFVSLYMIAAWIGFMLYSYCYPSFDRQPSRQLEIGSILANFELKEVAGQTVSSSSFSDKPTIWVFYRGNWCPLCMAR